MKLKFKSTVALNTRLHGKGTVADIDDGIARNLIERGLALEHKPEPAPAASQGETPAANGKAKKV
jgi:hypothetical protein